LTLDPATSATPWRDASLDTGTRVAALLAQLTLREKIAQLYGVWVGVESSGNGVAPHQHDLAGEAVDWADLIKHGIGQLTRPFGTAPVDPVMGARGVASSQRDIVSAGRFGIPAVVHEECLTGLAAWQATVFPAPLSWGASFDPDLVERMGNQIGTVMHSLGVHQGLAPVLDVVRDLRWGRVEETIGEDPHLVGTIGAAYVRGLESAGVIATLKHFVGYSASRGGRNLAPVSVGRRELADVLLPPFEMALRAGARSVRNSYSDIDGVPVAADESVLTDLLRGTYGFAGTVVADYFAVSFLQTLHNVATDQGQAAGLALHAGIDVELPTVNCYGAPLLAAVQGGKVDEALVDRAVERVLRQKCELGLLDDDWKPSPPALAGDAVELDSAKSRGIARELAEKSVVLLQNDGTLPLRPGARVAMVGPRADESSAMMGCYSFPLHVLAHHPDVPMGIEVPTLLESLRACTRHEVTFALGCPVLGGSDDEIAAAVAVARDADICVVALGDLAGLFGQGTSGEGCDVADLRLPGRQEELLDALLDTGTPVVLVLLVGRPYDISRQVDRLAAVACGFFPGEEGGPALAGVLTGAVNPSGRLPVGFPGGGAPQPASYLASPLARRNEVSNIDPSALFAFGHGLSYTPVAWADATCRTGPTWPTDGTCEVSVDLTNGHDRDATEVVQVYAHHPTAEVALPVQRLVAAARVDVPAGRVCTVTFTLHADLTSYTGRAGDRIVDAGDVELRFASSSAETRSRVDLKLTGPRRVVGYDRVLLPVVELRD
jgi:beta-xylosidase